MRGNKQVLLAKQPQRLIRKTQVTSSPDRRTLVSILNKNPSARVLVIRSLGGIGDVLMTTPGVRQLAEDYPQAHITYATERHTSGDVYYELLKNAQFIKNIVDSRTVDRTKFDGVVDISSVCIKYEHSDLPPMNRIDIFARAIGFARLRNYVPFYNVEDSEKNVADSFVLPFANKKILFFHTASFDTKRTWPIRNQIEFLQMMEVKAPNITILLSDFNNYIPIKAQFKNCIDVSALHIREKAALIERSDIFVGPDSGLMHMAGAIGTRGLALFGSISPNARINHYNNIQEVVASEKLKCQFCWYKHCEINYKCMSDITSEQVFRRIIQSGK